MKCSTKGAFTNMRTATELQEKIAHLTWYKHEVILHFYLIPMTAQAHAVAAAFYRTIDNEIALLRWALGQTEQTWSDDHSGYMDIIDRVENLPPTEFPHFPWKERKQSAQAYWGKPLPNNCPYFVGPDSPSDDPNFDPSKAHDPATWKRQVYPQRGAKYFGYEIAPQFSGPGQLETPGPPAQLPAASSTGK